MATRLIPVISACTVSDRPAFAETVVDLPTQAPGEFGFGCGMNMIHGLLAVDGSAATAPAPSGPAATAPAAE